MHRKPQDKEERFRQFAAKSMAMDNDAVSRRPGTANNAPSSSGQHCPRVPERPQSASRPPAQQYDANGRRLCAPHETNRQKRSQHELLIKLRNTIADTYQTPPEGADPKEIAERRAVLEEMLRVTEQDFAESKRQAQEAQQARWMRAQEQQEQHEAEVAEHLAASERRAQSALERARSERSQKLHEQALSIQERTETAATHLAETFKKRMNDVETSKRTKEQLYRGIRQRREEEKLRRMQQILDSEAHAQEMLNRKAERERQHQLEVERRAAEHRKAAEAAAERAEAEKRERAKMLEAKRKQFYHKGGVNKVTVKIHSKDNIEVIPQELDYAARLEQLERADVRRQNMVERVKAERQREIAEVRSKFKTLAEHQQELQEKCSRDRTQREEEIKAQIAADKRRVAAEREERDRRLKEQGIQKREQVWAHMQRAAASVHKHQDDTKNHVFKRWNKNTDAMMRQLCDRLGRSPPPSSQHHHHTDNADEVEGGGNADQLQQSMRHHTATTATSNNVPMSHHSPPRL